MEQDEGEVADRGEGVHIGDASEEEDATRNGIENMREVIADIVWAALSTARTSPSIERGVAIAAPIAALVVRARKREEEFNLIP